jgi:uncharacterized protein YcnI
VRRVGRFSISCLVAMVMGVAFAGVASAHVTISPNTAVAGDDVTLTFHVPDENDAANTNKLEVQLPADAGLTEVSVLPVAGWTYAVTKQGDSISTVTWSGGTIKPGEFAQFALTVGPLPKTQTQLLFKALQSYDNGDVVSWIETTPPGGTEPDHPAPVLTLTADDTAAGATNTTGSSSNDSSNTLAAVALGIAAVAVLLSLSALALNRKQATR